MKATMIRCIGRLLLPCMLASPAAAQDAGLAVAVRSFRGAGSPDIEALARGYAGLLSADLSSVTEPCRLRIVEWERRADLLREIELGKSPYADKASFAQSGQATQPDVFVDGSMVESGKRLSWHVKATDAQTGALLAEDRGSMPAADAVDSSVTLAKNLTRKLCKLKLGWRITGQIDEASIQGVVCGPIDRPFTATAPEVAGRWQFTPSGAAGGKFTYAAADVGGARGSGAGSYRVIRGAVGPVALQLSGTGSIHSPLGSFSAAITESLTLTPIPSCERVGDR